MARFDNRFSTQVEGWESQEEFVENLVEEYSMRMKAFGREPEVLDEQPDEFAIKDVSDGYWVAGVVSEDEDVEVHFYNVDGSEPESAAPIYEVEGVLSYDAESVPEEDLDVDIEEAGYESAWETVEEDFDFSKTG